MKFRKKKEKDGESTMWKYAKYAVVAVCVIGIGASSISVIPTGYTGVKSTFGKISEKELTTGVHFSVPFVQNIQTISNKQQDGKCEGKIWGETSDKTPVYGENVTVSICHHYMMALQGWKSRSVQLIRKSQPQKRKSKEQNLSSETCREECPLPILRKRLVMNSWVMNSWKDYLTRW